MRGVAAQVTSLRALDAQQASIESTLDSARDASRLAESGYRNGITEFLDVLAAQNAQFAQQEVNPIFTWVRLAQRVPVRVHLDRVPPGVHLAAGMTCTVTLQTNGNARS